MKNAIIALVLSIMLPAGAYAVSVSTYGDSSAETNVGVSGSVNVNVGAGATTSAGSDTSAETRASETTSADVVVEVPERATVIVITRSDVEASGEISASVSPASVGSEADLSGFVAAQIVADENLSKVESSSSRVSVTYPQKAMLFGFIPVTVKATATVEADGTVDVQYPWYAFLMVTNETALEVGIEAEVPSLSSATVDATISADLTAQAQAELIDEVRAVMEAQLALDASDTVEL